MGWARIVERGCGTRERGGVYVECGVGPDGVPLEHFLVDPPTSLPQGLDLVNKAQLWQHPETTIWHVMIQVGAKYYPYLPDYLEEVRLYGASRRINRNLKLGLLTPGQSCMYLAHPRARLETWQERRRPFDCRKLVPGHAAYDGHTIAGPCIYKTYELVPAEAGTLTSEIPERSFYRRTHASTSYIYSPTGESPEGLAPGFFAVLPIHGFALVKREDGTVDAAAAAKLDASQMSWYAADQ